MPGSRSAFRPLWFHSLRRSSRATRLSKAPRGQPDTAGRRRGQTGWAMPSPGRSGEGSPDASESRRWVRSESISGCSRIPTHSQSGSTSPVPRAPTAVEVVAAAPTSAGVPRVPSSPDQFGLPDLVRRGSGSSPSRRPSPSLGPIHRPGTSDSWAQGAGPPGPRGRRPARAQTKPTRHPPARLWTALHSPSAKDFPSTRFKASSEFLCRIGPDP